MSESILTVTEWTTTGTRTPVSVRSMSLFDLIEEAFMVTRTSKADLPLVKLASYGTTLSDKGALRWGGNITAISGVEGDYDGEVMPMRDAVAKLTAANVLFGTYTSFSHTAATPRWRVFCPLSEPMPLARRAALVARLNGVLGGVLAGESFTDAQGFYIGQKDGNLDADFHVSKAGRFIDLCDDLAVGAIGKTASKTHEPAATVSDPALMLASTDAVIEAIRQPGIVKRDVIYQAAAGAWGRVIVDECLDADAEFEKVWLAAQEAGGKSRADAYQNFKNGLAVVRARGKELGAMPPLEPGEDFVALHELTEEAAARAFARDNAARLRFDHSDDSWFVFDQEEGWTKDGKNIGLNMARRFVSAACLNPAFEKSEIKAAKHIRFARAIFDAGESDPLMSMIATDWNDDPMILGVPGGLVNLATGEMQQARASDLIRRRTAVAPAPRGTPAPLWTRFLEQATGHDEEMQAYLARLFGYWLTGDLREEKISFVYGSGGNGKGVLVSTVSQIMGEYVYQAPAELFQRESRINREYQLAMLMGRRLVIASETENKSALAESFVKELSGNEGKMNARHPYGRPFQFRSVAKLMLVGNHAPQLQGRTQAMERRLQVVPFNHVPSSPDTDLKEKLKAEWPAILRMAIDGCLAWQQRGLGTCRAIEGASQAYFAEQDTLAQWIEQRCEVGPEKQAQSSAALASFNEFARSRGEPPVDAKSFKEAILRKPGFTASHERTGKTFRGLSLRSVHSTALDDLTH